MGRLIFSRLLVRSGIFCKLIEFAKNYFFLDITRNVCYTCYYDVYIDQMYV